MIFLEKQKPAPTCLSVEKEKINGDYKCGCVLDRLSDDFHNRCYVCENKNPSVVNVEHFRPHKNDKDLKFDWMNLFLACGHCNNIKSDRYGDILDCTDPSMNVETRIKYYFMPFPKEYPRFTCSDNDQEAIQTKGLLEAVFYGTTKLKKLESAMLREELLLDIADFQSEVLDYFKSTSNETIKNKCRTSISQHLHKAARFCSFKRWIVRNNPYLLAEFGEEIL